MAITGTAVDVVAHVTDPDAVAYITYIANTSGLDFPDAVSRILTAAGAGWRASSAATQAAQLATVKAVPPAARK